MEYEERENSERECWEEIYAQVRKERKEGKLAKNKTAAAAAEAIEHNNGWIKGREGRRDGN